VALATGFGFWLSSVLPPDTPAADDVAIALSALLLGLYALTVDRCEVPGLLRSYRANLQNLFAIAARDLGAQDHRLIVPGRRLSFFMLPVVVTPAIPFLIGFGWLVYQGITGGPVAPLDGFRYVELPLVCVALWLAYAFLTRDLRRRPARGGGGLWHY
jgi:hypothetical protein